MFVTFIIDFLTIHYVYGLRLVDRVYASRSSGCGIKSDTIPSHLLYFEHVLWIPAFKFDFIIVLNRVALLVR